MQRCLAWLVVVEKKAEVRRGKKYEGKVNQSRRMEQKSCILL